MPAITQTVDKVGAAILVTHSAGGFPGWIVASKDKNVKGVAALEPGGFVFPEGEVPAPIQGLTGGVTGVAIPKADFAELCSKPIVIYFGDYIVETPSKNLGDENWRVRIQMARKFVDCINRHGGNATLVELPKIGIRGNTHFLMLEKNNNQIAEHLDRWIQENKLK